MNVPSIESLNTGQKRGELYIRKQFPEFYESLPKDDRRFPEILYAYYHGPAPVCPVCGGKASFISFSKGYSKYCSSKCANSDPTKKLKTEQTCIERYGHRVSSQSEIVKKKAKQTCIERYGEDYAEKQLIKRIATNLKKYGVEHVLSSPEIREKIKQTCIERYGVENVLLIPGQIERLQRVVEQKYGVRNVLLLPEIWDRIHKTCMSRYGVQTPFESPDIQKQCVKHDTAIEKFVQAILDRYKIRYIKEDQNVLPGIRVDFYIPDKKLIIETNGTYWHSDKCKEPRHHIRRFINATDAGYRILTIWEDQIIRIPKIVESVLLSKLGIYERRLMARHCTIREIDSKACNNFLNTNHIQGSTSSKIKLGAFINDELVGVMTFIQSRGCQGSKNYIHGQWELNRFCTLLGTQVVGLASKLLTYFIRQYDPSSIVSFSHNDISNGNVYMRLGFKKIGNINASYYYIKSNKRYHRSNFTRAGIARMWPEYDVNDKSWTERCVMNDKHYFRIYDCGTQKWLLTLNSQ